jgi:hypothetical protein
MAVVSDRLTYITETSKSRLKDRSHGRDRLVVVAEEVGLVAANRGQPPQPPIEDHESIERGPGGDGQEIVGFRGECAADHFADGSLLATAAPVNEWAADQPERQEADDRKKQDQQQPSRGR